MFAPIVSRVVLASALAGALLTFAASAGAQDADTLIKQGVELRRENKDQAALEQFQRAYDLSPTPRALAQMALAEQALGRWVDAEAHVTRALASPGDPWIAKYEATLERSREAIAGHLGSLVVTGTPAGAEVHVDGRPVGALPLGPLRLPTGSVVVDVSANGHTPVTRALSIVSGQIAREDFALPPTSAEASDGGGSAPRAPAPKVSGADEVAAPSGLDRRGVGHVVAWTAAGLAGVSAGAFVFAQIEVGSYNDHKCGVLLPKTDPGCVSRSDAHHAGNDVGWVSLAGAGVAGIAAAALILTAPAVPAESGARVACLPDLARPGATCAFRF